MSMKTTSFSRLDTYAHCPFRYRLRYIDRLEPFPSQDPYNPLYIGRAIHTAIEKGGEVGAAEYVSNFYVTTDTIEAMALQPLYWGDHIWDELPPGGQHEVPLEYHVLGDLMFKGFIDYLHNGVIYDFKVTNSPQNYVGDPEKEKQLFLYKAIYERINPGAKITGLKFVIIPKVCIRFRKGETPEDFRARMLETVASRKLHVIDVPFTEDAVDQCLTQFIADSAKLREIGTNFQETLWKNVDWSCERFCPYYKLCFEGDPSDIQNFDRLPPEEQSLLTNIV